MKLKNNFKVGDLVYTHYNPAWGMKPMKVVAVSEHGISCKHKDFSSIGWFYYGECWLATAKRKSELKKFQSKMDEVKRLKARLFKD